MNNRFFRYLEREHARLEQLIAEESRRIRPDDVGIARLKKQKLLVKDQIARWRTDSLDKAPPERAAAASG